MHIKVTRRIRVKLSPLVREVVLAILFNFENQNSVKLNKCILQIDIFSKDLKLVHSTGIVTEMGNNHIGPYGNQH